MIVASTEQFVQAVLNRFGGGFFRRHCDANASSLDHSSVGGLIEEKGDHEHGDLKIDTLFNSTEPTVNDRGGNGF